MAHDPFAPHHHGHLFGSTDHADSAGQPWAGRSFEANEFAGDDGSAPEPFMAALADWAATDPNTATRASAFARLVELVATTRFLIPLVAEAGDEGQTSAGLRVDKTQDLSVVNVAGPDGQRVLPVFTSVAAMTAWRTDARPVPVEGTRSAAAALQDDCAWMVIDPGSETSVVVRRPALAALVSGHNWKPAHLDNEVRASFEQSVTREPRIHSVDLTDGDPAASGQAEDIVVTLTLEPGLTGEEVTELVGALADAWSTDELLHARIDAMRIVLR